MGSKPRAVGEARWSAAELLTPLLACAFALGLVLAAWYTSVIHPHSTVKLVGKLLWKNASVRPPVLLVLTLLGWAGVIRVCRSAGMPLDLVLGGSVQPAGATLRSACVLLALVVGFRAAHVVASETPGLTWRPWLTTNLSLHLVILLAALLPAGLSGASRRSLVSTLVESVIAPFAPVTFWHVIVADYLTSMAKAFSDLQLTACLSPGILAHYGDYYATEHAGYTRSTALWEEHHAACASSRANAVMLALPFWWRLMQCLRVYHDTREVKNLYNALKYSTAFPLVYTGYLRKLEPSAWNDHAFVAAAILQSSYCFVWDVLMDWGLPKCADGLGSRHGSQCKSGFRETRLVFGSKAPYFLLCAFNFSLRFVWTVSVFGGLPGRGYGMFVFEVLEIARRTAWAVFRIEWEVVVKVYSQNAARAIAPEHETMSLKVARDSSSTGLYDTDDTDSAASHP